MALAEMQEQETQNEVMDQAIAKLNAHKDEWATLPIRKRIQYLQVIRQRTYQFAEEWVRQGLKAKGIPKISPQAGEEWATGPYVVIHHINRLIGMLEILNRGEVPEFAKRQTKLGPDGQMILTVFPAQWEDHLLYSGLRADVWMQHDVTPRNLPDYIAPFYERDDLDGKSALVLGAGNVSGIPFRDTLHKLFVERQVVILKMNPVNDYLGPVFEKILTPMVEAGYIAFAYGGVEVGKYLTNHHAIDEIHMTGSAKTHDAIVYGAGEAGARNKANNHIINHKRITSELGGVGATIVVPGPWTEDDLRFQAEHIATQKVYNVGFMCIASQVLITPETWKLTPRLIQYVQKALAQAPHRESYYPGADERRQAAYDAHPDRAVVLEGEHVTVPRTMIVDIDPNNPGEYCFQNEFFSSALAQTNLPGYTAEDFLKNAVDFANQKLDGTLGINIIIHPRTIQQLGKTFEHALADLHYGTIGVNVWSGIGWGIVEAPWGAYPGHHYQDIQSGIGHVHNIYMLDKTQKTVLHGNFAPFPRNLTKREWHIFPKPPWFLAHKRSAELFRHLTRYEATSNPYYLLRTLIAGLDG